MQQLMDYHHHSLHSFDSKAVMEDICRQAIKNGVKEMCFTEHFSVNPLAPTYGHMKFDRYFNDIESCLQTFSHKLTIRAGIELCEPHLMKAEYAKTLRPLPLDFIMGSVHNIDNTKLRLFVAEQGAAANACYFEEVYKMVCGADIDVIAHLDLIKRYSHDTIGIYDFNEHRDILHAILKKAIERGIGIEINTSGLRGSLQDTMPSKQILQLYKELGGEILTIGSDSHAAETVGANIADAYELAKECGFKSLFSFERRQARAVDF
ncbi:histidinol-phosphatase HisJ family protein [Bacillus sp. AGMB 02131]|uniref:Histidinol-phosphatase n=1 Tax=Peribacillus faecalis TaxID=2772559 RepID=A0A927CXL0_9BACI|nr:histidinol-phosphatase HisJ family protein [Peribacillus faecalis]MBD3108582.1 histidinol-phosphatase HisJ family protein [Peribacillus faecalis]